MREVSFYKDHIQGYEQEMKTAIRDEFRDLIIDKTHGINDRQKKINNMH